MIRLPHAACALLLSAALSPSLHAQVASAPDVRNPDIPDPGQVSVNSPAQSNQTAASRSRSAVKRRSSVHYNPYPYPEAYQNDSQAGFRNPGGVGRGLMWYPAGNHYSADNGQDPVKVANFMGSPNATPTFAENVAAQAMGVQKASALQNHIDNYARPYMGFGLGMGYFGGYY